MVEGGPLVDCGVHQIDLARWWLGSEVEWHRGIGVWVEDFEAPDHIYLHMGHACGAHTMVEMSFSYNATSLEPRSHFQYELIGTDGVIRYNREEHSFEVRNSHGTRWMTWHAEKNFGGMYAEFSHALLTGESRNMPTAKDGLLATRIARKATRQAIHDREPSSQSHHSTLLRSQDDSTEFSTPLDLHEVDETELTRIATPTPRKTR
jgi:predicted dehydrogenase